MDLTLPIYFLKKEVKIMMEQKKNAKTDEAFEQISTGIENTMFAIEVLRGKIDLDDESELNLQNVSVPKGTVCCDTCKYILPEQRCSHPQGCEADYELWEQKTAR